jgi:hypothetical protein
MWATDMDDAEAKLCENLDPEVIEFSKGLYEVYI